MSTLESDAEEFYVGEFGDSRLRRTGALFYSRIAEHHSVCLRKLGGNRAGEMRFGRWLSNPKVTRQEIMREASQKAGQLAQGRHVLAIQDTSELNYQKHAARTQGLGRVGNGKDAGLFIHPVLVVEAQSRTCLGLAHQKAWVRTKAAGNRAQLPIEEKESYRWLQAAQAAKDCLKRAALVTIVADRESDIYEEWDRIADERTHLLTRSCWDRKLADGQSLHAWLAAQAVEGCYRLAVRARPAKAGADKQAAGKRTAHCAQMEIRYGKVSIARPARADKRARQSMDLYAVEVRERPSSVVAGEEPIHWRLLTTHCIEGIEAALQIVQWYGERWQIEQLFRVLKKQGLNIESSQVEQGESLMKLASLATLAAVRTLQLTMAREGNTQQLASDVFDEQEIEVLEQLQPQLEGRTDKQKNPHQKKTLAWAGWMLARLGGWKGYASEARPGPITMLEGQQRFFAMVQGWKLANLCA